MINTCNVIRDLLPLYLEGMVSEDTAAYVEEHLNGCPACAAEYEALLKSPGIDQLCRQPSGQDTGTGALKAVKAKLKRRRLIAVFTAVVLTVAILFLCMALQPASIYYGESEIYSRQDMNAAIQLIKDTFYSWDGCKLYSISYTDDDFCKRELDYCNTLAGDGVIYTECIVFRTRFRSPIFGGGAWNANFEYDWSWYLARQNGGAWDLLTWGMP